MKTHFLPNSPECIWAILAVIGYTLTSPPTYARPKFIEFDVPGSQQTVPRSINDKNSVSGSFIDQDGQYRGFLRTRDGSITTFDVAGSFTIPTAINDADDVAGYYSDGPGHGFIRAADGLISTIDVPGAMGTEAWGINNHGVVAGYWFESSDVSHGFVRAADGTISTFDAKPRAVSTTVVGINDPGYIVGSYNDGSTNHGYLRKPDGKFLIFDAQGASGQLGTVPYGIDDANTVVGFYEASDGQHGFIRTADGEITTIDFPDTQTLPVAVALAPAVSTDRHSSIAVGEVTDLYEHYKGFVRFANGKIRKFDAPDAGTGSYEGTGPSGINARSVITGSYVDSNKAIHGFLRLP